MIQNMTYCNKCKKYKYCTNNHIYKTCDDCRLEKNTNSAKKGWRVKFVSNVTVIIRYPSMVIVKDILVNILWIQS